MDADGEKVRGRNRSRARWTCFEPTDEPDAHPRASRYGCPNMSRRIYSKDWLCRLLLKARSSDVCASQHAQRAFHSGHLIFFNLSQHSITQTITQTIAQNILAPTSNIFLRRRIQRHLRDSTWLSLLSQLRLRMITLGCVLDYPFTNFLCKLFPYPIRLRMQLVIRTFKILESLIPSFLHH